jgi:hypothetical protein
MNKFVAIYVTSTRNGGEPIEPRQHEALVSEVCKQFSRAFGGCTQTDSVGYWESDTKGTIRERVVIVKSFHDKTTKEALAIVTPIAQAIKYRFNQEAVSVETEQGLEFI